MTRQDESQSRSMAQGYELLTVGITFALTLTGFLLGGYWLDERWHSSPLCIVSGALLGTGLGGFWAYQRITRQIRNDK